LEAFDGKLASNTWIITIDLTYDPPILSDVLVDQTVKVGRTLIYKTPASRNIERGNTAIITSPGLPLFASVTTNGVFTFSPPHSIPNNIFRIQVD